MLPELTDSAESRAIGGSDWWAMFSEHGYRTIRGIAVSDERDPQRYMSDVDARAVNHLTDLRQTHLTDLNRDAVGK